MWRAVLFVLWFFWLGSTSCSSDLALKDSEVSLERKDGVHLRIKGGSTDRTEGRSCNLGDPAAPDFCPEEPKDAEVP